MTTKKTSKNVIDYDPLAWLNEEADEPAAEGESDSAKTVKVKKKATKKAAPKKKAASKKTGKKKAPQVTRKETPAALETMPASNSNHQSEAESAAFGFFDDEDPVPKAADEEPAAFGFFDEEDQAAAPDTSSTIDMHDAAAETKNESIEDSDEGSAYGFFDEADALATQTAHLDSDTNVINLGADLTIRSVGACKALIEQSLSNGFDVRIAAGELQKIDSAGLQLIYSLKTTLEKTAQSIQWESTSSIINDAAKIIGMPKLCDDDDSDPGYGFFADDNAPPSPAENSADEGYGFF